MNLKKDSGKLIGHIALYVFFVIMALVIILPFLMMFVNSFKPMREAAMFKLTVSMNSTLDNYKNVLSKPYFWRGLRNSAIITFFSAVIVNISAAMGAYAIQRRGDRLGKAFYFACFVGMIIPVSMIPTIKLLMALRLHNTFAGIILYYGAINLPFSIFLLTGYMKSLPREIDEAAMIEGCAPMRLFYRIILPLMVTPLVTSTIVTSTAVWNDFNGPFYLISDSNKWPIAVGIYNFVSQYYTNWGTVFAFMTMSILPVLVLYAFLQRYIIAGLTSGSIKG